MSVLSTPRQHALMAAFVMVAAISCDEPKRHSATIALKIDGKTHDCQTKSALVEVRNDPGKYSIYLRPDRSDDDETPHISLRTFSGNPVARLAVRYGAPSTQAPIRFECFVPGRLSDGRETLTWKKADGKKRDRTQTGEADCKAAIERKGKSLRFTFEATLQPAIKRKKKKGRAKAAPKASAITISGSAIVEL